MARRSIDERAPAIRACAGQQALAVRVDWDTTGALQIRLQGPLLDGPEQACVRVALEGLRVPPGASGAVIHPIMPPSMRTATPSPSDGR